MGGGGALRFGEFPGHLRFLVAFSEFNALVDELRTESSEFARWWKAHEVDPKPSGRKVMIRPNLGPVLVVYSTFQANDNPDLRLVLYEKMTRNVD
jgi:hypothetical protein